MKKYTEAGRSLIETLAILAVIALLTLVSVTGYNFIVHYWRKQGTVKQISELAIRYKLNPLQPKNGTSVNIKSIYPEAERSDAVTMKTMDISSGRVRLEAFDKSSFMVIANEILDDSCEAMLKNGEYEGALVTGPDGYDEKDPKKSYVVIGREYLKDFDYNRLTSDQKRSLEALGINSTSNKQDIINAICVSRGKGKVRNMALVWGDNCANMGSSWWYAGRCWTCPQNQKEDAGGNCCDKDAIDDCGYCLGKCPNGGKCHPDKKVCVECLENTDCKGENKICDKTQNKCIPCIPYTSEGCVDEHENPLKGNKRWCSGYYKCEECLENYDADSSDGYRCPYNKSECTKPSLGNWACKGCSCEKFFQGGVCQCKDGLTGKIEKGFACSSDCQCAVGLNCEEATEGETCATCQCVLPKDPSKGRQKGEVCNKDCPCGTDNGIQLICRDNECTCKGNGETCTDESDSCCSGYCNTEGKCAPPSCEKEVGDTSCSADTTNLSLCCKDDAICVFRGSASKCCSNDGSEGSSCGSETKMDDSDCCEDGLDCRNHTCCSGTGELESVCTNAKCCNDSDCIGDEGNKHCCVIGRCNPDNSEHPCCENSTDVCFGSGYCCPAGTDGSDGSSCTNSNCCESGNCVGDGENKHCCPVKLPDVVNQECLENCGCGNGLICDAGTCKASCSNTEEDRKLEGADCSEGCPCGEGMICGKDSKCHICPDSTPYWYQPPGRGGKCCAIEGGIVNGSLCSDNGECCQSGHCAYYADSSEGVCCPEGVEADESGNCLSCGNTEEERKVAGAVCSDPACPCVEGLECNEGRCCPSGEKWTEKTDKTPACCAQENTPDGEVCTSDACCASGNCAKLEGEETGYCCPGATSLIKSDDMSTPQCCEKAYKIGETVPDNSKITESCCEGGTIRQPFRRMQAVRVQEAYCVQTANCKSSICSDGCGHTSSCTLCECVKTEKREEVKYTTKKTDVEYKCCMGDGKFGSPCSNECPCEGTGAKYYDLDGNYQRTEVSFKAYYDNACSCSRTPMLYCRPLENGQGRCEYNAAITEAGSFNYTAREINCSYNTHDFSNTSTGKCYVCPADSSFRENSEFVACCPVSSLAVNDTCEKYPKTQGYVSKYTSDTGLEAEGMDCSKMDQNDFYLYPGFYCDERTKRLTLCSPGSYCQGGKKKSCEPGTYSNQKGASSCQFCKMGYYCPEGSTEVTRCPVGYYCPDIDTAEPIPCPPGSYSTLGSQSCKVCEVGFYCPGASNKISCGPTYKVEGACPEKGLSAPRSGNLGEYASSGSKFEICPKGYKCDGIQKITCESGEYQDETGQSECKKAPVGAYVKGDAQLRYTVCPAGSYSAVEGASACTKCPSGTYQDEKGQSECKSCPDGMVSREGANTEKNCSSCPLEQVAQISASKQQCCTAAQRVVKNGDLEICCGKNVTFARLVKGTLECCSSTTSALAQVSADTQLCCGANYHAVKNNWKGYENCCASNASVVIWNGTSLSCCSSSSKASARVSATQEKCCAKGEVAVKNEQTGYEACCPEGQRYCRTSATSAAACRDPSKCYYSEEQVADIGKCSSNMYLNNGKCTDCPEGKMCDGFSVGDSCPKGTYAPKGAGVCTPCAPGTYQNNVGKASCTKATGAAVAIGEGNIKTTVCGENEQPNENHDGCEACPDRTSSRSGSASCTSPCYRAGTYYNSGTCAQCPQNHYCPKDTLDPIPCPFGSYSMTGKSECTGCPDGQYWDSNSGTCKGCTKGSFCKNGVEEKCPEGTNSGANASKCVSCNPGQYFNGSNCVNCAKGTYSDGGIVSKCTKCSAGKFAPNAGMKECLSCAAGTYSAAGASACTACGAKKYSTVEGATNNSVCQTCEAGYYCPADCKAVIGTETCNQRQECPAGYYCLAGQNTGTAHPCPKNTYRSEKGGKTSADCTPCPAGTYTTTTGSVKCIS